MGNPVWANNKTEILWDNWGIPHIFASDEPKLMEAFGWAQAQGHGDLLLTLYGEARCKRQNIGALTIWQRINMCKPWASRSGPSNGMETNPLP